MNSMLSEISKKCYGIKKYFPVQNSFSAQKYISLLFIENDFIPGVILEKLKYIFQ